MTQLKIAASTILYLLLAGQAHATFELRDPAAEIYNQKPPVANDATGRSPCIDFLRDSVDNEDSYEAKLSWMQAVFEGIPGGTELESALRSWCIDNPKQSLQQAAAAMGGTAAD